MELFAYFQIPWEYLMNFNISGDIWYSTREISIKFIHEHKSEIQSKNFEQNRNRKKEAEEAGS
jgi:hypothetical protein